MVLTHEFCNPSEECVRDTPWGTVKGMKCKLGPELYHNTTVEGAQGIAEEGFIEIKDFREKALGQDAISYSSCPSQPFGGMVKLVMDSEDVPARAACYVDFGRDAPEEHRKVSLGMQEEARRNIDGFKGDIQVRAEEAIQPDIYTEECEYIGYEKVPSKKVKKVQYWIPWDLKSFNHSCEGHHPAYANVHGYPIKHYQEQISKAKKAAEDMGAEFEVKSCFSALKSGRWGDYYIPLTDENLKKLERGETPPESEGKTPEKCLC